MVTAAEQDRLKAVRRYDELNISRDKDIQDVVSLAATICGTPVALVTLIDEDKQWFKVRVGVDIEVIPRQASFCTHTIAQEDMLMVVSDTTLDPRFVNNPLVADAPNVRFYAGASLISHDGYKLGSICVLDDKPKTLSERQQTIMKMLSKQVTHLMELELSLKLLEERISVVEEQTKAIEARNEKLQEIAWIQSHKVRAPLASIMGLVPLMNHEDPTNSENKEILNGINSAAMQMDEIIKEIDEKTRIVGI